MEASEIIALISEILALIGVLVGCIVSIGKVMNGTKCLLPVRCCAYITAASIAGLLEVD